MKRVLKENLILIVGIALPILLVIVFYLAAVLPKILVKSPKIDLLYLTSTYPHDGISTEVIDGTLKIWITPEVQKGSLPMPRLFRFSAKTLTSTEIPIHLSTAPGIIIANKQEMLSIPAIKDLKLDTQEISSDGYKAEISSPNTGSVANLFLLNTKRALLISKNGHVINVSDEKNKNSHKYIKFLGWIRTQSQ
ncbi:MAG TPA: hypothetical protein PK583_06225 [Gammaproteobacteria bacterium]|nr:hypothetical protein [Gammaproteobacteria bacterium]HQZ87348.1 hypothetical protein [Gammaproteobacteria bacterium]HRA43011.1 hypothetical protein [Gammaproteobacteria bacterium]